MDKIRIKKLDVFAKHGVYKEENVLGQKFVFSATLLLDTAKAGASDALEDSVNYGEVCHFIREFAEGRTFKLLESLAEHAVAAVLDHFPLVKRIDLEIEKPWAPIGLPLESVSVEISRGWHQAFIALGSNMGDKKKYLDDAVKALDEMDGCRIVTVADYIETEPYGGVEQDDFLNSVLLMETRLEPDVLLEKLHEIEALAGRKRTVRWGPRTLDLDIIFYDDVLLHTQTLTLPHPEMHKRSFVLDPLVQIAPWAWHPALGKTVRELWEELKRLNRQKR